jgi:hypothetical protein
MKTHITNPFSRRSVLACSSIAALLGACSGESAPSPEPDTKLIAQLNLGTVTLSYYEPEPGTLVEAQTGRIENVDTVRGHELSFTKRYELLSGKNAPQALVDAEKRATAIQRLTPDEPVNEPIALEGQPDTGLVEKEYGPYHEELFLSQYCEKTDRFWGSPRWTGDSWWEGSGLNFLKMGVYVTRGNIVYKATWTGYEWQPGLGETLGINKGEYAGFRVTSTFNRSGSSRVSSALGDVYHHCINYHF